MTAGDAVGGETCDPMCGSIRCETYGCQGARRGIYHVPAITELAREGVWGVYCLACSDAVGDYVTVCEERPDNWPPLDLIADPSAPSLRLK